MFFFSYSGKSGHVFMENGTRVPEFVVGNFRDGSYKFVGNRTILLQNGSGSIYHNLKLFHKSEIRWPGGSSQVPVSDPVCGFTGNDCREEEEEEEEDRGNSAYIYSFDPKFKIYFTNLPNIPTVQKSVVPNWLIRRKM